MTRDDIDINHNDWAQYNSQGYLMAQSIQVRRLHDGTVRIGSGYYDARDLLISADRIEHSGGAWYLAR